VIFFISLLAFGKFSFAFEILFFGFLVLEVWAWVRISCVRFFM
jgi:hypothetical protein